MDLPNQTVLLFTTPHGAPNWTHGFASGASRLRSAIAGRGWSRACASPNCRRDPRPRWRAMEAPFPQPAAGLARGVPVAVAGLARAAALARPAPGAGGAVRSEDRRNRDRAAKFAGVRVRIADPRSDPRRDRGERRTTLSGNLGGAQRGRARAARTRGAARPGQRRVPPRRAKAAGRGPAPQGSRVAADERELPAIRARARAAPARWLRSKSRPRQACGTACGFRSPCPECSRCCS